MAMAQRPGKWLNKYVYTTHTHTHTGALQPITTIDWASHVWGPVVRFSSACASYVWRVRAIGLDKYICPIRNTPQSPAECIQVWNEFCMSCLCFAHIFFCQHIICKLNISLCSWLCITKFVRTDTRNQHTHRHRHVVLCRHLIIYEWHGIPSSWCHPTLVFSEVSHTHIHTRNPFSHAWKPAKTSNGANVQVNWLVVGHIYPLGRAAGNFCPKGERDREFTLKHSHFWVWRFPPPPSLRLSSRVFGVHYSRAGGLDWQSVVRLATPKSSQQIVPGARFGWKWMIVLTCGDDGDNYVRAFVCVLNVAQRACA